MYYNTHNTIYIILEYKSLIIYKYSENKNNNSIFNMFHHIVVV